jgi:hypothetical protein
MLANRVALNTDIWNEHGEPGRSAYLRAKRAEQLLVAELALAGRRHRALGSGLNASTRTFKPRANSGPRPRRQIKSAAMYPGGVRVITDSRECPRV